MCLCSGYSILRKSVSRNSLEIYARQSKHRPATYISGMSSFGQMKEVKYLPLKAVLQAQFSILPSQWDLIQLIASHGPSGVSSLLLSVLQIRRLCWIPWCCFVIGLGGIPPDDPRVHTDRCEAGDWACQATGNPCDSRVWLPRPHSILGERYAAVKDKPPLPLSGYCHLQHGACLPRST